MRLQMLAKFAADERLEQLTKEARRQKMIQFKAEVERLLDERRAKLAAERERELSELVAEREREKARMQIIEEERQRLLREHATKLLGYLPRVRSLQHSILETLSKLDWMMYNKYSTFIQQIPTARYFHLYGSLLEGCTARSGRRGVAGRVVQARVRQAAASRFDRR